MEFRVVWPGQDLSQWDNFVAHHEYGSEFQLGAWGEAYDEYHKLGIKAGTIILTHEGQVLGGNAFLRIELPVVKKNIFLFPQGPLLASEIWWPVFSDNLFAFLKNRKTVLAQFEGTIYGFEKFKKYFSNCRISPRRIWRYYNQLPKNDFRLPLKGRTKEEIFSSFNATTRNEIRRAIKDGVEISSGKTEEDFHVAYDIFQGTSVKKNYSLRPRTNLVTLMKKVVERGQGNLIISKMKGETAAAIFVVFCGVGAKYLYGGFINKFAKNFVNRILHWRAIEMALERECQYYSMGPGGQDNVERFKFSFGCREISLGPTICVIFEPAWAWALEKSANLHFLRKSVKRWRRWLVYRFKRD